jgi:hypothetical protein
MNKKEFFEYVVPKVESYLTRLGFVYKKSRDGFIKLIEDGCITVPFSFYQYAGTDNFNVGFEVRKNSEQEIYVKYVKRNPVSHATSNTFGFYLVSLLNQKDNAFPFIGNKELDVLLKEKVVPFLEEMVPVFTEHYSKLSNIYALFTDATEKNNKYIQPTYSHYISALIMGWLLYPNDFDRVVNRCNELFLRLKERWPDHLHVQLYERDFNNIVEDLKRAKGNPKLVGNYWTIGAVAGSQ